jgi:hypothetical protein
MQRHGIVVPGLGEPPPRPCGGPAWCATCNAEMLQVEQMAFGFAVSHERRLLPLSSNDSAAGDVVARRWVSRIPYAERFRVSARHMLHVRRAEAVRRGWKLP